MQVYRKVDRHLRTAYSGALKQDPDLISQALKGLSKTDGFTLLLLGLFAVGFIVNDIYPDGVTDEGVRKLASR